jgi:hypothetical protein
MRGWSDRIGSPNFIGGGRPNLPMAINPHAKAPPIQQGPPMPSPQGDATIFYSFNVPFASDLTGPNTEDILHATTDAVLRWTHPEDAPDDVPVHELPVHSQNLANLRRLCRDLSTGHLPVEAHVVSSTPKNGRGQVTTVCLSGPPEFVQKGRETILNETPISLVRSWQQGSPLRLRIGLIILVPSSRGLLLLVALRSHRRRRQTRMRPCCRRAQETRNRRSR